MSTWYGLERTLDNVGSFRGRFRDSGGLFSRLRAGYRSALDPRAEASLPRSETMLKRTPAVSPVFLVLLSTAIGCGPPIDDAPDRASDSGSSNEGPVRTADPGARGLSTEDFPRVQELAPGVYSYEQLRSAGDERFATVSLFVVTEAGVLVADGQGSVDETRRLVETIAGITDQPITHVVIASDHGDHTAGNSAFPTDAVVLAHPTSLANLQATADRPDRPMEAPPVVLPTRLVEDSTTLDLGGTEVRVQFLGRAHTGGDLVVYLPESRILFMSEAYLNRVFPAMRAAYPSEWVTMIERAQAMDVEVYVPGHGFVDSPAVLEEELETYRRALERVIAEVTRLHDAGLSVDEALEAADFGDLDTWSLRSSQGPVAVRRVYLELDGQLP